MFQACKEQDGNVLHTGGAQLHAAYHSSVIPFPLIPPLLSGLNTQNGIHGSGCIPVSSGQISADAAELKIIRGAGGVAIH